MKGSPVVWIALGVAVYLVVTRGGSTAVLAPAAATPTTATPVDTPPGTPGAIQTVNVTQTPPGAATAPNPVTTPGLHSTLPAPAWSTVIGPTDAAFQLVALGG